MEKKSEVGRVSTLTRGGVLALNTFWNLAGQAVPLIVAVFAILPLIYGLG